MNDAILISLPTREILARIERAAALKRRQIERRDRERMLRNGR